MKQCYSNTISYFLSENFLLEKSKELLKLNLVFRACLLAESFLPKLNRPWLCASNLIISTKTLRKTPIDEYILRKCRLLLEYESIAYFFVRFIFFAFPKVSRNCRWRSHFFTKTQSYSPQNSTKPHHRCFHEDVLKHLHWKLWKISTFPKSFRKCVAFSLTLQVYKVKFGTSIKTPQRKCFRSVLSGNSLNEDILLK